MPYCHHCRRELLMKDRVGRRDTCAGCGADLRCCLNCAFYDPRAAHACREPDAEPVQDKEAGNFCDFFALADRRPQAEEKKADVRAQLDALFKKKS